MVIEIMIECANLKKNGLVTHICAIMAIIDCGNCLSSDLYQVIIWTNTELYE